MTDIRSPIFTQYRSADKLYVFSSENGETKMSVYDRDHRLLKTQVLSKTILQNTPLGQRVPAKLPQNIVRLLLQEGYAPTTQPDHVFAFPYHKASAAFEEQASHTLEGHSDSVWFLQVLPNGCLASGSDDNTIKIWDPKQGFKCIHTLKRHSGPVYALRVLANGLLASGSRDNTIKIWDPKQGFKCIHTLKGHSASAWFLQVLPNGCLASGSADKTIKIWDPKQGFKCIQTLEGHSNYVLTLQVLPNGSLASSSLDNTIKIWDPKQGFKCIQTLEGHSASVQSLQVLPNGSLASGSYDNTIKIWDPKQGFKCIQTLEGHSASVESLQVLPNGSLASSSRDNTIKIWDPKQGFKCIQTLEGHSDSVWSLQVLPNGSLASSSWDNTIKIWNSKQLLINPTLIVEDIRKAIVSLQQVTIHTDNENLKCAICLDVFNLPVMTNCGHTFCKECITTYLTSYRDKCPMDRTFVESLQPNITVIGMVDSLREQQTHVPTFLQFKQENSTLANSIRGSIKLSEDASEHEGALSQAISLLKYSKNWKDYAHIPRLMEKVGNERAIVTYLYLARYQVEAKAYREALASLKKAVALNGLARLPLVRCQHFLGHKQEAISGYLTLAKEHQEAGLPLLEQAKEHEKNNESTKATACKSKAQKHLQQAVTLCQSVLKVDPLHLETYRFLASLLPRQHQAHIYLKAALHFIQSGDVKNGEALCKKAHQLCSKAPVIHHLPHLRLLLKQNRTTEAVKLYLDLANIYTTEESQLPDRIFCFENLLALAPKDEYYKQIITAYRTLGNKPKELHWYLSWINKLISEQKWQQAESIATTALNQSEDISVLQRLEAVYGNWQGHKLSNLWMRLGTRYEQNKQLTLAEQVYRKAYERFHEYRHTSSLAKLLVKADKKPEGVKMFYQAANSALLAGNLNELNGCIEAIRAVDPSFRHLSESQRTFLITHQHLFTLSQKVITLETKLGEQDKTIQQWQIKNHQARSMQAIFTGAPPIYTLEGHSSHVYALQMLPNGCLASGSNDNTIKIWDPKEGFKCIQTLEGHSSYVISLHVLPNGCLASGSNDNTIKIWDVSSGACLKTLKGHGDYVHALQVLPNGYLVSGSGDKTIKIWDLKKGFECIQTLDGGGYVYVLQMLPNGCFASGSYNNIIKIWDPKDGFKCIQTLKGHGGYVVALQMLPNGCLASGANDKTIKIWDPKQGFKCIQTLEGHSDHIFSLQVLSNGCLASRSRDNTIKIWDPKQGFKCIQTLEGHSGESHALQVLPNGYLASGFNDYTIKIWGARD